MNREEMISRLCFREEGMYLTGKVPTRFVTVSFRSEDFSDDELALLVRFSDQRQAAYERRYGKAKLDWADNFISFEREDYNGKVRWGRKRWSWREGNMYSSSLPEALVAFWNDSYRGEQVGDYVLFSDGEIAHIHEAVPYAERVDREDFRARRIRDGQEMLVNRYDSKVVIAGESFEDLGRQMIMAMEHRIAAIKCDGYENYIARRAMEAVDASCPVSLSLMWESRVLNFVERQARQEVA